MKETRFTTRKLIEKFVECSLDERGATTVEYLITMVITLPAAFWLIHPDNGIYKSIRDQFNMTTLLLMYPGP